MRRASSFRQAAPEARAAWARGRAAAIVGSRPAAQSTSAALRATTSRWAAGLEPTIAAALPRAGEALASGAAWRKLEALRTALALPAAAAGGG